MTKLNWRDEVEFMKTHLRWVNNQRIIMNTSGYGHH